MQFGYGASFDPTPTPVLHWIYEGGRHVAHTELELLQDGVVVRVIPVEAVAVTLGRDPASHVMLVDGHVSGHHAVVQRGPEGPVVRDLGSTNGTFLNDRPVEGWQRLEDGDALRLGPQVHMRVHRLGAQPSGVLVVRDLTDGQVHLIAGDRFCIGSADDCHFRQPRGPARAATLVVHGNGETWLGADGEDRALPAGSTFVVGGTTFRLELLADDGLLQPTARPMLQARYPYRLTVTLDAAAGALAHFRDTRGAHDCRIRSEQRVSLLYLLARQLDGDRKTRVVPPLAGWCHDEDLMVGVWGRQGLNGAASRYSVLLHRVRKDLEGAGLDPWCLEKRRGATRLQVQDVQLA